MSRRAPRARHLWSILVVLAVLAGLASVDPVAAAGATPAPSDGAAPVAAGLEQRAAESDVRVIAVTEAPGEQVVDDVLASVPEGTVSDVSAGPAPQVVATVDAEGLEALSQAPGVTQVVEDKVNRMAADTWPTTTGVSAAQAAGWDGTGRTVAVLDAGVQSDHPFLSGKVLAESCFSTTTTDIRSLCDNGVAQQFGTGAARPCTGIPGCDHGTHVAGLAVGGPVVSPVGLTGAAQGASLVAAKVFSKGTSSAVCGGAPPCLLAFDSDIIAAMSWIETQRQGNVAGFTTLDAVNLSLGGGLYSSSCDAENPSFTSEVEALRALGVLTVAAAGNGGSRTGIASPGCISSVVSVGATNGAGSIPLFSNLSSFTTLLAPGVSMTSSVPDKTYQAMSGTSMATPVISGSIAAVRQKAPTVDSNLLVATLRSTGDAITANVTVNGATSAVTFREVQLDNALAAFPATVPSAPRGLTLVPGDGKITASWADPVFAGNGFSGYTVSTSPASAGCVTASTGCTLTGLVNGTSYRVAVVAANAAGAGGAISAPAIPFTVPSAPVSPQAVPGDRLATVSWSPPASNGGSAVTGYVVTASPDGQTCSVGPAATSCVVNGLSNWVSVSFTVVATNAAGAGSASVATAAVVPRWPGSSPFGSIDQVAPGFEQVVVSGWAIDPDTPSSIQVQVAVDGVVTSSTANGSRPDVDAVYGYGPAHGYSASLTASPGPHTVCVTLLNVGVGSNVSMGCRSVTVPGGSPFGSIDQVTPGFEQVVVSGWAIDPDVQGPIPVQVYVDGASVFSIASGSRPDVGGAFPGYGPGHGYSVSLAAAAGPHTVCVYALNVSVGSNVSLGCRSATVPGGSPFGSLDSVARNGDGSISASGWAIDPDVQGPVQVLLYVAGNGYPLTGSSTMAGGTRLDVGVAYPLYGPDHGFTTTVGPVIPPNVSACVYVLNVGLGTTSTLGCRLVP